MADIDNTQPLVIYIKPTCPFCKKALALLDAKGFENVTVIDIAADPSLRPEMIEKANGRTTVPQVFLANEHIGGCDDLHDYFAVEMDQDGMFCAL